MQPYQPQSLPISTIDWERHIPLIGAANAALARFDGVVQPLPNPELLLSPIATQEAVLSSRIEGTRATVEDVLEYDAEPSAGARNLHDIEEVDNYRKALTYAVRQLDRTPITLNLIRETHEFLLDGVRGHDKRRGEFRRDQNWIGRPGAIIEEAIFVPPSPIDLPGYLGEFEKYLHFEEKDRLVQLAVIHGQFELLHPFLDGNGRIGRILIPLFLFEKGLIAKPVFYISRFFEARRDVYYDRLRAISVDNDWDGWIEYFLEAIYAQAASQTEQVVAMLGLYQEMKDKLVDLTRSHLVIQLLDYMFARPVFKAADFGGQVEAARNTVLRLLRRIEESGIIVSMRKGPGRGGIVYRFEPLVKLLTS